MDVDQRWRLRLPVRRELSWVIVALAVAFASCGDDDGGSESDVVPSLPDGRYVALGDSYAAGEGLGPYQSGTQDTSRGGDRCHRSPHAYPNLVELDPPRDVQSVACSGAETRHIADDVQRHDDVDVGHGIQADDSLGDDVALVTITIGGNDVMFSKIIEFCYRRTDCLTNEGWPFGGTTLENWAVDTLQQLGESLEAVYTRLLDDAPEARVLVVGYPELFTEDAVGISRGPACAIYDAKVPGAVGFRRQERRGVNDLTRRFNAVIAAKAVAAGAEYVHVEDTFGGHETCGDDGAWLRFGDVDDFEPGDGNFHPTRSGQRKLARLVGCYLRSHGERPYDEDVDPDDEAATVADALADVDVAIGQDGDDVYECTNSPDGVDR